MLSTWAVDNLFIGRTTMNPSTMQDDFENDVQSDSWLFVNDGVVGEYCQQNVRYNVCDVLFIPPVYEVYRGYIFFAFSVRMFVCVSVNFFSVKDFSETT